MGSRRKFVAAGLASAALSAPVGARPGDAPDGGARRSGETPRNYVLVHGSWHGGWCWRHVASRLRAAGHRVFTPTLTGLGERVHLRSPEIGLETHIADVVNVAMWEELQEFVIVGHSYGGTVITGICDRLRARIRHAVYLDAPAPRNGECNAQGQTPADLAKKLGPFIDGYLVPVRDDAALGLGIPATDHANTDWLRRRLTPHPVRTWTDPLSLAHGGSDGLARTYVFCNRAGPTSSLRRLAETRRADPTWTFRELSCGHDAMVILPGETAQVLLDVSYR